MTTKVRDDAAFIGKLTAGATHEIRNVLSVIKESTGLMDDLMEMREPDSFPHAEKFKRMIRNILGQIERGSVVVKALNTLAHATDERRRTVDAGQVVECQIVLYERFCRGKGVTLSLNRSTEPAHLVTDPVRLHGAVGAAIDFLLERAPGGSGITVSYRGAQDLVSFELSLTSEGDASQGNDFVEVSGETWHSARSIVESLGGSIEVNASEHSVRMTFPMTYEGPGEGEAK